VSSGSHPPGLLMLHLLGRCNLECRHCYMEGSPRRKERLPVELVLRTLGECQHLGIGTIVITGGEPLLYRELDQVLEAAAGIGGAHTTLCSNGTLLSARRAERFRTWGLRINVSIDGRPEFHDYFRKSPGAFHSSERGIRAATEAGIPVTVISSISKDNLDSLDFLVNWASEMGADQFYAQPLLSMGRGTQIANRCLTFTQLNRLILKLTDLANRPGNERLKCQVIGAKKQFLLKHPCGAFVCNGTGCHRGVAKEIKKLVIREDGTVLPEVPTLNHRYALGNIREGSLSELVSRYFERGYDEFDMLCRAAYAEILPDWDCIIVPWEQIISEKSYNWIPAKSSTPGTPECFSCKHAIYGATKETGLQRAPH
jgi:Fe-coproporphyrin III synthase